MEHSTEVFVGIDVAKARNAVAIAADGRGGEVRYLGEVDAPEESTSRLVKRIAAKHDRVHFCYEAGPTGYGRTGSSPRSVTPALSLHPRSSQGSLATG